MESNIAIKLEHISKVYKIYDHPVDRLKESLHPLRKRYHKDFYALSDVSFEVKKGETVGIIGKNGAGKSTLLKIITGVLTPTGGVVDVQGKIASLLELGAGFNPEMSGIENIYLNGTIMGCSKEVVEAKLQAIVDFADIGDFINQPVKMYSSGMFARLAFAVNAFVEPDILIVDEALSVGDIAFQAKCITKMRQMIERGATVLFVTHDMATIKSFCEKCIYLKDGTVKMIGNAEEIADIYLRETRDEMNRDHNGLNRLAASCLDQYNPVVIEKELVFRHDEAFAESVRLYRQGNGKAKIVAFELLDLHEKPLVMAEFAQEVILRLYIESYDVMSICVGYHIRDDKNIEIIGTDFYMETEALLSTQKNGRYVVDFLTSLPIAAGAYNIVLVLSEPLDEVGESVIFVDIIENATVFEMCKRDPVRIWNKVYIPAKTKTYLIPEYQAGKHCACCGSDDVEYVSLGDNFLAEYRKYGCNTDGLEMLNIKEYSCSRCGAADRDRIYAAWMKKNIQFNSTIRLLDIAPAGSIRKFIKSNFPNIEYKTADLFMDDVDYRVDIMDMAEIATGSFGFFICSHVLEHVADDVKAMKELWRILSNDGRGILVVPIDLSISEIDEDPSLTDVEERWRRFGQGDHIRRYSKAGFLDRIRQSGLAVEECGVEYFGEAEFTANALTRTSVVYIVSKGTCEREKV